LATDAEFVRRFEEEAAAVAQLRHPNIIQVYDFNHDDETYFMVLEFIAGETLFQRLTQLHSNGQRLPTTEAVRLITAICDAVQYAHERNLIHRDLKPANVMINTAGQPILMDFGIAKIVGGARQTATGALVGTPTYISPEQVRGETLDHRVDIYALGVILYEMVAGRVPFDADSALSIMLMHVNEPVPDIRQLNRDVPEGLVAVIEKALAKQPGNRFQSAREMAQALKPFLPTRERTQPVPVVKTESLKTSLTATPTAPPPKLQTKPDNSSRPLIERPRNWLPVLASLAAIVGIGFIIFTVIAAYVGSVIFRSQPTEIARVTQASTEIPVAQTESASPTAAPEATATIAPLTEVPPPPTATLVPTDLPTPEGMAVIPFGFFQMGSNDRADEQPEHPVLMDAFYLDVTEVTNSAYRQCVEAGGCSSTGTFALTSQNFNDYPVINISWNQAQAYCAWAGKRLPTEAEWEYAASGPDNFKWPWGNEFDPDLSAASAPDVQPVGSYPAGASPFGIVDMAGNVTEWVRDKYSTSFYAESPLANPLNLDGPDQRIYRGGSYGNTDGSFYTTSRRFFRPAAFSDVDVGFRCAKDAPEQNAVIAAIDRAEITRQFCALYDLYRPSAACP
jgi:serine/threonine protein kinase